MPIRPSPTPPSSSTMFITSRDINSDEPPPAQRQYNKRLLHHRLASHLWRRKYRNEGRGSRALTIFMKSSFVSAINRNNKRRPRRLKDLGRRESCSTSTFANRKGAAVEQIHSRTARHWRRSNVNDDAASYRLDAADTPQNVIGMRARRAVRRTGRLMKPAKGCRRVSFMKAAHARFGWKPDFSRQKRRHQRAEVDGLAAPSEVKNASCRAK